MDVTVGQAAAFHPSQSGATHFEVRCTFAQLRPPGATCRCPPRRRWSRCRPRPACRRSTASSSAANSASRPTSGDSSPAMPRSLPGTSLAASTRYTGTGSALPLTSMGPSASVSNSGATSLCVASLISTVPGSAASPSAPPGSPRRPWPCTRPAGRSPPRRRRPGRCGCPPAR